MDWSVWPIIGLYLAPFRHLVPGTISPFGARYNSAIWCLARSL
ncbi:hypothetical protein [Rossellomorea marisflavi]|nr:hypothetical protein [Rossellomorea marisflavi]